MRRYLITVAVLAASLTIAIAAPRTHFVMAPPTNVSAPKVLASPSPQCLCPLDSGGPRVVAVVIDKETIWAVLTQPVSAGTVTTFSPPSVLVSIRDTGSDGNSWIALRVQAAPDLYQQQSPAIRIDCPAGSLISGNLLRVVLRGTGPAPIVDENQVALAGADRDSPTATGADYVYQQLIQ